MEQRAFNATNVPARLDCTCSSFLLGPGAVMIGHGQILELGRGWAAAAVRLPDGTYIDGEQPDVVDEKEIGHRHRAHQICMGLRP
jgi:hypothetical protein